MQNKIVQIATQCIFILLFFSAHVYGAGSDINDIEAQRYINNRKYQKAIDWYTAHLSGLQTDNVKAYIRFAKAYAASGDEKKALKILDNINVSAVPHNMKKTFSQFYVKRGQQYSIHNEYDKAVKEFMRAIEIEIPDVSTMRTFIYELYFAGHKTYAMQLIEAAQDKKPGEIVYQLEMANIHRLEKEYEKAIDVAEKAIAQQPNNEHGYVMLGWIYADKEEYEEGERALLKAIELNPDELDSYARLGDLLLRQGKNEEALKWLLKAQNKNPSHALCNEFLGRAYTQLEEYDKAEQVLTSLVKTIDGEDSYWGCPFQALGALYSHMSINDKKKKVIENFIKTADIEKNSFYSQYQTALICYKYGDFKNALKYIDRAIQIKPDLNYVCLKGFIYIHLKEYKKSAQLFRKILADGSDYEKEEARVGLGHIYLADKDASQAEHYFNRMLRANPEHIMANLGMAWKHANENQHEQALPYYESILKENPEYILALLGKGNSLMGLHRIDEAEKLFEKVLRLEPDNEYALAEIGIIQYNRGEIEKAEGYFKQALERNDKTYTCPYEGLGLVYLQQGKLGEAEDSFRHSIAINPDIEYKKYNGLAKIYIQKGDLEEAKKLLRKSIENYPYDDEARQLLNSLKGT